MPTLRLPENWTERTDKGKGCGRWSKQESEMARAATEEARLASQREVQHDQRRREGEERPDGRARTTGGGGDSRRSHQRNELGDSQRRHHRTSKP
ncbi:hypothetical protein E2562_017949 [Oryza meyeriana var. granulata]|uniref:Uncharacterized protein n=1 Tax=Oryza meyeriana var. granulata TaxID=110450 RepID=A0A6G1F8Z5_9ORYZ|nr:hypothetical protein E2562_017949 [Oryza meyeriana var. granulata]